MKSEFGQGYAVCLIQFLFHAPRLDEYVKDYADMRAKGVHAELFTDEHAVEMWADGAVDHLWDIRRPRRWISASSWQRAKQLRDRMGAAKWSRFEGGRFTVDDMRDALNEARSLLIEFAFEAKQPAPETFDAAWALDESAGLKPLRGDAATCSQPIAPRKPVPA
jgi:hypothetical protein